MANTLKFGNGNWAVKEGSTLAYNDENGNFKPLPFDFERSTSATRVNKQGLIETVGVNQPRVDFSNDANGALLLEPQRTNGLLHSNQFDSTWSTTNASLISGQSGVGGSSDAWKYSATANSDCYLIQTPVYNSGTRTRSLYAKADTFSQLTFLFAPFNGNKYATFNLANGTYTNDGCLADIEDVGDGWYRCIATITDASNTYPFLFGLSNESGVHPSIGDSIYIQYAQIEEGSYPTSYIPTSGSAVTRVADYTKILNSPILQGTNQFTLFFEAKDFLLVNGTNVSFSNVMLIFGAGEGRYDSGTGLHIYDRTWFYYNGSSAVNLGICYNGLVDSKFAISYDGTKFKRYAGGVKLGEFVTSASMVNWDTIATGGMSDVENDDRVFNLSDLRLYNTALTDAELQALTSN